MMFMNLNAKSNETRAGSTPSIFTKLTKSDDNNGTNEEASKQMEYFIFLSQKIYETMVKQTSQQ